MSFRQRPKLPSRLAAAIAILALGMGALYLASGRPARELSKRSAELRSSVITDRHGSLIAVVPNARGYFARPVRAVPVPFRELLLKHEDRFFSVHPGVNPFSLLRQVWRLVFAQPHRGGSTLTQQLVKILLGNENRRTWSNKLRETWYAVSLELHTTKDEVLAMYAASAYFGGKSQGLAEASRFYFDADAEALSTDQILQLLATLGNPADRYPGTKLNAAYVMRLRQSLGLPTEENRREHSPRRESGPAQRRMTSAFETSLLPLERCQPDCSLTVDRDLTEKIRGILDRNLRLPTFASIQNGAVVVIATPSGADFNELLAVVGSPDPSRSDNGYQLNMAALPRPIGSTAKPFIYARAFAGDLRPYTLVDDREYRYPIGTGYALYPKNYDGKYRGTVTLHAALANSLNVPAVKVLEHVGLDAFSDFLRRDLGFRSLQPLESYGLGIALGALEMDLLTLTQYVTIFPTDGVLRPLAATTGDTPALFTPPMSSPLAAPKPVATAESVQLVSAILSDRLAGAEQFGLASNLNLPFSNSAVKTGTSRDYHDSWTIGYTPSFVVGVWLGNSSNTPMHRISGQLGSGKVWHEVMQLMATTPYYSARPFARDRIREFKRGQTIEYGLPEDNYDALRAALQDFALIVLPHQEDEIQWSAAQKIPLTASRLVRWSVNGRHFRSGKTAVWSPAGPGVYQIEADDGQGGRETVVVTIHPPEE